MKAMFLAEYVHFGTFSSDALLATTTFSFPEPVCFGKYLSRRLAAVDRVVVATGLPGILMRFNASGSFLYSRVLPLFA
jgi:hypothetical protein